MEASILNRVEKKLKKIIQGHPDKLIYSLISHKKVHNSVTMPILNPNYLTNTLHNQAYPTKKQAEGLSSLVREIRNTKYD